MKGLVVVDKAQRVAQYHAKTVRATLDLITSAGLRHTSALNRTHVYRRTSQHEIKRYDQIFPYLPEESLLGDRVPDAFKLVMQESAADSFVPASCLTRCGDKFESAMSLDPGQHRALAAEEGVSQ